MKQALRNALAFPFRLMPSAIRYRILQLAMAAEANRHPVEALRALLKIDDHLTWEINRIAVLYDRGAHVKHRLTKYHDFFVSRINPADRVLDLGCGRGEVANSVAEQTGAEVVGIDLNSEKIEYAKSRYKLDNLEFCIGDILVDLPEGPFDVIVFSNVLEHIDQRVTFLQKVQESVRPDRWLIRVPMIDRDWRVPLRQELGLPYFSDGTHFTEYTRESFCHEMSEAGLFVSELIINWGEIWAEVKHGA